VSAIPVTRAAHLFPFLDVLYELGVPVERELLRAKLPILLEEMPDAYISEGLALDFVAKCARLAGLEDIGWMAAKDFKMSQLSPVSLQRINQCLTLNQRLSEFTRMMWLEDPLLLGGIYKINDKIKITCDLGNVGPDKQVEISEWMQVMALISMIRESAGRAWQPIEISFQTKFQPCDDALEHFANARFIFGGGSTSITVLSALLTMPTKDGAKSLVSKKVDSWPLDRSLAGSLRAAIRPYVADGYPSIELAAEIAGTSKRGLQRKLKRVGTSYSEIVDGARFEIAAKALSSTDNKIIDIGFMSGYDDPSHFARAFRRISGMSPREYRASCAV
jgi:AraC-like DNA-binding protein